METTVPDQPPDVIVRQFELPSEASTTELRELLNWFRKASAATSEQHPQGDARCQLLFPPALSKDARKHIHQLAQTLRLPTFSKGVGEDRRLMVHGVAFRDTAEMEAEVAAVAARRRAPATIRDRARLIWKWCQADGGALWSLSVGELEESLLSAPDESGLPPAVKDLLERRQHGTALISAIRSGDNPAALAVLDAHPRAAWIRDDTPLTVPATSTAPAGGAGGGQPAGGVGGGGSSSTGAVVGGAVEGPGYYPLHLAAMAGMGEVVDRIAAQPGAVEQRDRNYATPLKVAKKAGLGAMVEILLRHGAKDYEVNQAAHKTAPLGIPIAPPAYGRRMSGSLGGSPHLAGSPTTASSPHTTGSLGSSYMAAHVAGRQRRASGEGRGPHSMPQPHGGHQQQQHGQQQHGQHHQQHGWQQQHHPHGFSGLGAGQPHRGSGHGSSSSRRSLDEQHHPHHHPHPPTPPPPPPANDPTINPFAVLAGEKSGGSSRRSSAGGLPPRPPALDGGAAAGASDSDSSTGTGGGGGYGSRVGASRMQRVGGGANRCALPPIQSGELSEVSVMAALASMGLSAKPGLPTAPEAPEEAGGAGTGGAGSDDDDDDGGGAGGDDAPKKRKTRRGRRGRGSRRQSSATADEAVSTAIAAAAAAVAAVGGEAAAADQTVPQHVLPHHRAVGPASVGADSSDRSGHTDGSDSDGSGDRSKPCRGGQPARARRHERRRAARVSGADGGGGGSGRRSSGAEYSNFHPAAVGHGRGAGGTGGHYSVYGSGVHHGHADDAGSWRRDAAAAPAPAGPAPIAAAAAAAMAAAAPGPLRGGPEEPRQPMSAGGGGRPPAPRRTSAGPGLPASAGAAGGGSASAGGATAEAPGSPFHYGGVHGPREHVAVGPTAGVGFGRGRGRGMPPGASGLGSGVPSAPGSPMRPPPAVNGSQQPIGAPPPVTAAAAAGSTPIIIGATR